jgi:hypothetical protein
MWREVDELGASFFASDKINYTLRYEDLVTAPEEQLRKLCRFLDEPFEPAMLDTTHSGRDVNRTQEPWKEKAAAAIDRSRCAVWREQLNEEQMRLAESVVGDRLEAYYGQRPSRDFAGYVSVFPLWSARYYPQVLAGLAAKDLRIWPTHRGERPSMELYIGDPDKDDWLARRSEERLRRTMGISLGVLRRKLFGRRLYWIRDAQRTSNTGMCNRVLRFLMKTLTHIESPSWLTQDFALSCEQSPKRSSPVLNECLTCSAETEESKRIHDFSN